MLTAKNQCKGRGCLPVQPLHVTAVSSLRDPVIGKPNLADNGYAKLCFEIGVASRAAGWKILTAPFLTKQKIRVYVQRQCSNYWSLCLPEFRGTMLTTSDRSKILNRSRVMSPLIPPRPKV